MFDLAGWLRRIGLGSTAGARTLTTLLTPTSMRAERPFWQALGAAATLGAIGLAAVIGLLGAALVTLALGAIYILVTEILGLDLELDPAAARIFSGFSGFGSPDRGADDASPA